MLHSIKTGKQKSLKRPNQRDGGTTTRYPKKDIRKLP